MAQLHKLKPEISLDPGAKRVVQVGARSIALFNLSGTLFAIDDSCPHGGASLAGGKVEHGAVQCPAHGLRFNLSTGRMVGGPLSICTYSVTHADGCLTIDLPESELP